MDLVPNLVDFFRIYFNRGHRGLEVLDIKQKDLLGSTGPEQMRALFEKTHAYEIFTQERERCCARLRVDGMGEKELFFVWD